VAARALQGLGAAAMMTLSVAFIGETVSKDKTGSSMGLLGTMSAIGTALGPSLGGVLIGAIGWQSIFLLNVPLGILTFILTFYFLPSDQQKEKNKEIVIDKLGTSLLFLTLASYSLALTIGRGTFGFLNLALLLTAVFGFCFFILAQIKTAAPLIKLNLFREPQFSFGFALSILVAMVLMTTLVVGPFYLSITLGLNSVTVGMIMSIGPLAVVLTGIPIGHLVDKLGEKRLTILGLINILVGSFLLAIIPASLGIIGYVVPIIVITVGYAIFQTANNTFVMKDVQPDQRGVISGLLNLSRNLGLITGTTLMGAVFAFTVGTNELSKAQTEAVARGMQISFALATILIFAAFVLVVKMGWIKWKSGSQQK
ncbi:MAG TPA: MFS transporter, partial [Pyrinomonadaceae bacterium]|nr:MFS transporter [Pyrinomonadaceae bacterium]